MASVKGFRRDLINLHAPTPFAKIGRGYFRRDFVKEFCYTSGYHGSIWANFCSPSKTTKLVQISIVLPERASKQMQLLKEPAFYVNIN